MGEEVLQMITEDIVAEHLKTASLSCPGEDEILIVEVGGPDFEPSEEELEEIAGFFMTALGGAKSLCPAVVTLNRGADVKARALKIEEAIDLVAEMKGEN